VRLTVTNGEQAVDVHIKGSSRKTLRQAKRAARQLLRDMVVRQPVKFPFGFVAVADTQPVDQDEDETLAAHTD